MKWSWRLGRIAGIDIRVHVTFFLLLAWVAFSAIRDGGSTADAVAGLLFTLALFASVVAHEFGHALTARRYGVGTRDITLLPIGGVAQLERMPREPTQELVIALAGPAVTVALVVVLWAAQRLAGVPVAGIDSVITDDVPFLTQLMYANAVLAVFNMLPAFPMDGGRVLRALLAMRMPYHRATAIAANVGKVFAVAFFALGMYVDNPMLFLVALFVWIGGSGEAAAAQVTSVLSEIPVQAAMISDMRTLAPDDPLRAAVEYVLAGFQHDFLVVLHGRVAGILTRAGLLAALARRGLEGRVGDIMEAQFETTSPRELLADALARLQHTKARAMPVLDGDRLVGILTAENVSELVMIDAALRRRR